MVVILRILGVRRSFTVIVLTTGLNNLSQHYVLYTRDVWRQFCTLVGWFIASSPHKV